MPGTGAGVDTTPGAVVAIAPLTGVTPSTAVATGVPGTGVWTTGELVTDAGIADGVATIPGRLSPLATFPNPAPFSTIPAASNMVASVRADSSRLFHLLTGLLLFSDCA